MAKTREETYAQRIRRETPVDALVSIVLTPTMQFCDNLDDQAMLDELAITVEGNTLTATRYTWGLLLSDYTERSHVDGGFDQELYMFSVAKAAAKRIRKALGEEK